MERALRSDPRVRVFAPQYPTRKGIGIRSAVVLANLKDNSDLKLSSHDKNAEKFCGHRQFDVVVDTNWEPYVYGSLHQLCKSTLIEFYMDPCLIHN